MYVLGSELWEENFEGTLRLVKEFIVLGGKEAVTLWQVVNGITAKTAC